MTAKRPSRLYLRRALVAPLAVVAVVLGLQAAGGDKRAAWFFFAIGIGAAILTGWRFRRGDPFYLPQYRSALPAVLRNLPLVALPFGVLLIPVLVLLAPVVGLGSAFIPSDRVALLGILGIGFGYLWIVLGTLMTLAAHPPRWFVPRWLADDDKKLGYLSPFDLFDKATVVLGLLFVLMGIAATIGGLAYVITRGPGPTSG